MRLWRSIWRFIWRLLWIGAILSLVLTLTVAGYGYHLYREARRDLPSLHKIIQYNPSQTSRVYAANGELIGEFYVKNRLVVPFSKIPRTIRNAFLAAEDQNFYKHHGWDPQAILRAAWNNLEARQVVQGGSTITQQLVKTLAVGTERSYRRKIREAILAEKLERLISKNRIFEIYLNEVYLGSGAYGVEAAARTYFDKSVSDLSLAEATMIAGLSKAPSQDSPRTALARARARQKYVLDRMTALGMISEARARLAWHSPLGIKPYSEPNREFAPYFLEQVRKYLVQAYSNETVLNAGLEVYTTVLPQAQRAAQVAIRRGLADVRKTFSLPSPVDEADKEEVVKCLAKGRLRKKKNRRIPQTLLGARAIVMSKTDEEIGVCISGYTLKLSERDSASLARWQGLNGEKIKARDVIIVNLEVAKVCNGKRCRYEKRIRLPKQKPIEAALVAMDLESGEIIAMVGGSDFRISEFNRAVQAKRQIGSAVKGLVYAAAIEQSCLEEDDCLGENTLVPDEPISVPTLSGLWSPKNYKREFLGPITLRTAFAKSINTVSVRLALAVGVSNLVSYFARLGITSPIPNHISIALGTVDASLLELVDAYSTFPRGGVGIEPHFITKVMDANGRLLEEHRPKETPVRLSRPTSYVVLDLMRAVTDYGTGRKARALLRPNGGKTGTSTDYRDAWFIGFTPDVIAGVWVGRDDFSSIGHDATGGRVALPIWLDFMQNGHPQIPVRDFPVPEGIEFQYMDQEARRFMDPKTPGAKAVPFRIK